MRYSLLLLLITACVPQYQSIEQRFATECSKAGVQESELEECISSALKAYYAEIDRQQKEFAKAQEQAKKAQVKADRDKCASYGLTKGTEAFATCMMKIEDSRKQDAIYQQQLAIQQQQLEAQKTQAMGAYLQGLGAYRQATTPRQPINCTSTQTGSFGHTTCY